MVAILTSIKTVANGQPVTRKDFGASYGTLETGTPAYFSTARGISLSKNDLEMGLVGQGARAGCGSPF